MKRRYIVLAFVMLASATGFCRIPTDVINTLNILNTEAEKGLTIEEIVQAYPELFTADKLLEILLAPYTAEDISLSRDILTKAGALIAAQEKTFSAKELINLKFEYDRSKDFIETLPVRDLLLKTREAVHVGDNKIRLYYSWNEPLQKEVSETLTIAIDKFINHYKGKITTKAMSSMIFGTKANNYEDSISAVGQRVEDYNLDILVKLKILKAVVLCNDEKVFFDGKMVPLTEVLSQNTELAEVFLGYSNFSSMKILPSEIRYYARALVKEGLEVKGIERLEYVERAISKKN